MSEVKNIGGLDITFDLTHQDVLDAIDNYIASGGSHYIYTPNPLFVLGAQEDSEFMSVLNAADLLVPDGVGILFAKKYLERIETLKKDVLFSVRAFFTGINTGLGLRSKGLSHTRVSGSDLIYSICEHAAKKGYSVMLVGGWQRDKRGRMLPEHGNIATKAAEVLRTKYTNLHIVGATSDISPKQKDDVKFINYAHDCMKEHNIKQVDIVFAAFNTGGQEKWLSRVGGKIPLGVGLGVGASFDFVIDNYKRAPSVMKGMNLEWLYRLVTQPWRLPRIIKSVITYPFFIFKSSLTQK